MRCPTIGGDAYSPKRSPPVAARRPHPKCCCACAGAAPGHCSSRQIIPPLVRIKAFQARRCLSSSRRPPNSRPAHWPRAMTFAVCWRAAVAPAARGRKRWSTMIPESGSPNSPAGGAMMGTTSLASKPRLSPWLDALGSTSRSHDCRRSALGACSWSSASMSVRKAVGTIW